MFPIPKIYLVSWVERDLNTRFAAKSVNCEVNSEFDHRTAPEIYLNKKLRSQEIFKTEKFIDFVLLLDNTIVCKCQLTRSLSDVFKMPISESVKKNLALIENVPSKVLGVKVNGKAITPGQYIPKAEAATSPELSFQTPSPGNSSKYLLIALDIDAPFPCLTILGPILHWIQSDLSPPPLNPDEKTPQTSILTSTESFIANYIGPAPPPFSAPHRYCFFLYDQPEGFDRKKFLLVEEGNKVGNGKRMWFDLDAWERKVGVGEVVAVNYFTSN